MAKSKKKNGSKTKPMDPIDEEETASLNQEFRFQQEPPTNSGTAAEIFSNNSPKAFRLQTPTNHELTSNVAATYSLPGHRQKMYAKSEFTQDINANPMNLVNPPHENPRVKIWRLDDTSNVTKLLMDSNRFNSIESMFRPYVIRMGEQKGDASPPFDMKEKRRVNKLNSEVAFLNSGRNDVRFVVATKNNLSLYDVIYEYKSNIPRIQFSTSRQIPSTYDDSDYTCRSMAVDNSKENRIALGLNSGDIFVTSIPVDRDFNFTTSYHIKMRQHLDSIVDLAFDKTTNGQSYLCCGYERGRESEHFLSMYDVNLGKDLILDRGVSEKIYGMQFLNTDLAVLLLNCMKSVRFVDIRERSGFASIINLTVPLYKVAIEPYNNVQFAGVTGNNLTIFDRRFLSKALYDFQVGPESYNISHLEWNPNRYSNITCSSVSSNLMFELDILPAPNYAHHLLGNKSSEPQEAIVTEYANKFSYGLEKIATPLSCVQNFAWCHENPNILVAASPCRPDQDLNATDWIQVKLVTVESNHRAVSIPSDNSIIYCEEKGFNQIKIKSHVHQKKQPLSYVNQVDSNLEQLNTDQIDALRAKKLELAKKIQLAKSKPTFELQPEEIDLLFEMEQRELELLNEKIDYDHFESRPEVVQRRIPFLATKKHLRPPIDKSLQLYFTRSDINQLSITRAKLGYGFATVPGSAKALIDNSYLAIRDRENETECLKNCWKMLARIYSSKLNSKLLARYGTVFPGVRRMSHKLVSQLKIREDKITFRNKYYVSERRDDILHLVGWMPLDDLLNLAVKLERLMNMPDLKSKCRAASMATFYLQGYASKLYLEKTASYLDSSECASHYSPSIIQQYKQMVKKMLEVIETNDGIKIKNFENLLEEVEDPYLHAMLLFLGRRQFGNTYPQRYIMATNTLRIDDRLAIACIHLDDDTFRHTLKILTRSLQKSHDPLSVLLISGLDDHRIAHLALHSYLKQTNDIQTTALILCAGNCFRRSKIWETYDMRKPVMARILQAIASNALKNTRKYSLQIVCSYMEWLQANNLTLQKSYIMTFLRKKIEFPKNDPKIQAGRTQGLIACNFCGKPILPFIGCDSAADPMLAHLKMPMQGGRKVMSIAHTMQMNENERRKTLPKSRGCPHCGRPLPRCLICKRACIQQQDSPSNVQMHDWFIWCSACAHGGHLSHLRNWFSINQVCPAGDCRCACPKVDKILGTDLKTKTNNQEQIDDSFLINGFNVNILSATVESSLRSRHNSEQDKMRLIRRLCKSPRQSTSALDKLYRKGSTDSGITLNMANPMKSICALKSAFSGSEFNSLTNDNNSISKPRGDLLYPTKKRDIRHNSEEPHNHQEELNQLLEEPEQNHQEKPWNMTPEVVKQVDAVKKLLRAHNFKNVLEKPELGSPEDEQTKSALITSSDNLSFSEVSRSQQRRQRVKMVPKKQNKLNRLQPNLNEPLNQQSNDPTVDTNKWITNSRDSVGRQIATQVKVNIDDPQKAENEPTSSQLLENNIRFNQHTILLPVREQTIATAWLNNPQALEQLVMTEILKSSVAEETANIELKEKRIVAQLVKDQLVKEQARKDARERRKQLRDNSTTSKHLRTRPLSQTGSSYFSFDYGSIDIQSASSESEVDNSDAEEVARLVENVKENIRQEEEEIQKLRQHGYHDLNSLASAIKDAEEKKKRSKKIPKKRVRIRTTPDIRIATPALEDQETNTSTEISPRQRKNSSKMASTHHARNESGGKKERKASAEQKVTRRNKN